MEMRVGMGWLGAAGLALPLVTSCTAPESRQAARAPAAVVADSRELVRRLAPDVGDQEIAAVPAQGVAGAPLAAAPVASTPFLAQAARDADAARARDCLTAAVYHEARSEPVEGQRAVAQVVLNRVRDRAFPHSVCGVVYQGVGKGRGCQFSFACDGSTLRPRDPSAWERAERVAVAALNGGVMADVGNATFYHASYVLPWWARSLTRLGAVGSHIFYRWPGAVERALGMRAQYAGVEPGAATRGDGTVVAVRSASAFGVTVHRGERGEVAAENDAPTPVARPAVFSGVRVHRGQGGPSSVEVERGVDTGT